MTEGEMSRRDKLAHAAELHQLQTRPFCRLGLTRRVEARNTSWRVASQRKGRGMKKLALLCATVGALVATVGVSPAGAAPDNKNTATQGVVCDPPIGATQVTFVQQSSGESAFFANGMFGVVKVASFTGTAQFAIEGGPTFTLPDEFAKGGNGQGYQGKLVECTAQISNEAQFTLTKKAASGLGAASGLDLTPYIGSTVHVSESGTFTAEVILPGA
jgi:hypothetical protein